MRTTSFRKTVALLTVAAAITATAAPAQARPNNNDYSHSAEGYVDSHEGGSSTPPSGPGSDICQGLQATLDYREAQAEQRAGTKAAQKWSDLADDAWEDGVIWGCWG